MNQQDQISNFAPIWAIDKATSEDLDQEGLKEIAIFDRQNDQVHVITYKPNPQVKLYQEIARVVGDFYANQYQIIIPVSSPEVASETPVNQQIELYTSKFSLFLSEMMPENDKSSTLIRQIQRKWAIARKWLIKLEWDEKLPVRYIHTNKKSRDRHKPMGELLQAYWKLCERCHSWQKHAGVKIPYTDASTWFTEVFYDLLVLNVGRSLVPKGTYVIHHSNIKEARIEIEKDDLRLLKAQVNPFTVTNNTRALFILISTAIKLSRLSPNGFEKDFWKPYIKAMSAYIEQMDGPEWGMNLIANGKHYIKVGRGKGKIFKGNVEAYKKFFPEVLLDKPFGA